MVDEIASDKSSVICPAHTTVLPSCKLVLDRQLILLFNDLKWPVGLMPCVTARC